MRQVRAGIDRREGLYYGNGVWGGKLPPCSGHQATEKNLMKSRLKSLFRKTIWKLAAWTLVLSVIQGVCIYYFITRYTTSKITVQTNLINRQTDKLIEEMKNFPSVDELKIIKDNIEKIDKEVGIKIETLERDILKEFTPTLKISTQKSFYVNISQVKCIYSILNKGKYSVNISNLKFYLATTKIKSPDKINDQLLLNKDYHLKTNMNVEDIAPGEEIKRDLIIEFISPEKISENYYYCVTFDAQTDPNIVKSVKNIDADKINSKKFYYILGDIITPG